MTATVGAGSQEALAAPPVVPPTPAQPSSKDPEHERQLLQALTTEHFTLQTVRSAIVDSNGRSALVAQPTVIDEPNRLCVMTRRGCSPSRTPRRSRSA